MASRVVRWVGKRVEAILYGMCGGYAAEVFGRAALKVRPGCAGGVVRCAKVRLGCAEWCGGCVPRCVCQCRCRLTLSLPPELLLLVRVAFCLGVLVAEDFLRDEPVEVVCLTLLLLVLVVVRREVVVVRRAVLVFCPAAASESACACASESAFSRA